MSNTDYYQTELEKALEGHDASYMLTIKVSGTSNASKNLSLNAESISVLIRFLKREMKRQQIIETKEYSK
jgi:hypothetical protein